MSSAAQLALQERMQILRKAFANQMPDRLRQLDDALAGGGGGQEEPLAVAERVAHSIRGTGGTFGYAELAAAAGVLEGVIKAARQAGHVGAAVGEARGALQRAAAAMSAVPLSPSRELAAVVAGTPWLVASPERDFAGELIALASDWLAFGSASEALEALSHETPGVVLVDLDLEDAGEVVRRVREQALPVVGISSSRTFEARLRAVRMNVTHFLTLPLDAPQVIERVDRMVHRAGDAPPRVVIVDDDKPAATLHGAMLEAEGMLVRVVTEPEKAMQELEDFAPDVVLVDLYMPGCSGLELAMVLRYEEAWVGLPIMFLSAEKNVDKHMVALGCGADDFMVKPVAANQLVSQVRNRVARARAMRALMHHDSLTGLLNHISFKERLAGEVSRCNRERVPLAVALIDLDKFKHVNDTYGHPVGDRVLRTLSRVLRQRLRRSDGIGRYGGEEFAIVLPGARPEDAARVLDEIRESFAAVVHHAGARSFQCTLSAGVTILSVDGDARAHEQLLADADSALYRAKGMGRNRVVVARPTPVANAE